MYRKFSADYIFNGYQLLPANTVLITDDAGTVIDISNLQNAPEDIQHFDGLICPGFINTHCHLELSHLKGKIPSGTGLVQFVQQVIKNRMAPEEVKQSALLQAEDEMFKAGIVAVGDICNTTDSIRIKQYTRLHWHNFIEVSGFTDAAAENRLLEMKAVFRPFQLIEKQLSASTCRGAFKNLQSTTSFSPHAPYSVSKKLFQLLNTQTAGQLITIHNQECTAENELYQNKSGEFLDLYKNLGIDITAFENTGLSSLRSWLPYFNSQQSVILVHNTFTNQADIDFIQQNTLKGDQFATSVYHCLCINANQYIEQQAPPVNLLRDNNCVIVLGTDSYASNWQLNMLEEIKAIQKKVGNSIPLTEILGWATINGASALQMENVLGSFEKGKQPGIVYINKIEELNITQQSTATRIL